ncbi:hypothetical protein [Thiolapillus sp.]|uniref:hypothetical protein n=1 Tax=Thiolapillus sp. TaxID=2017437 RepID=UPI003AF6CD8A
MKDLKGLLHFLHAVSSLSSRPFIVIYTISFPTEYFIHHEEHEGLEGVPVFIPCSLLKLVIKNKATEVNAKLEKPVNFLANWRQNKGIRRGVSGAYLL